MVNLEYENALLARILAETEAELARLRRIIAMS